MCVRRKATASDLTSTVRKLHQTFNVSGWYGITVRVTSLLIVDRQPVMGPWDSRSLNVLGLVLPVERFPGRLGLGVYVEALIEPHDVAAGQLDVWVYVRPLDDALGVVDELVELIHLIDTPVAPAGSISVPVIRWFVAWIPSYPVEQPRQLWVEARLDSEPQAERLVSLVPSL